MDRCFRHDRPPDLVEAISIDLLYFDGFAWLANQCFRDRLCGGCRFLWALHVAVDHGTAAHPLVVSRDLCFSPHLEWSSRTGKLLGRRTDSRRGAYQCSLHHHSLAVLGTCLACRSQRMASQFFTGRHVSLVSVVLAGTVSVPVTWPVHDTDIKKSMSLAATAVTR